MPTAHLKRFYYDIGVNGLIGGTFGRGLGRNITEAYKWLIEEYAPGDDVFIFGFSRGAYTARSLAGLIAKYGLLTPGAPLGIDQIYQVTNAPMTKLFGSSAKSAMKER